MLIIDKLTVTTEEKQKILSNITLEVGDGKIVYLLGPNGSGKSTMAKTIMGFSETVKVEGKIKINEQDLKKLDINKRAQLGIFLAFQTPVEIPGVSFRTFLRIAYNNKQSADNKLSVMTFKKLLSQKAEIFNIPQNLLDKNLNENLSGGEKKKMELLQMVMLEPKLVILDEVDSGLDIDATKDVYQGLKKYKEVKPKTMLLIITHSLTPFSYLAPDKIYVLKKGKIFRTGNKELVKEIEEKGFNNL